MPVPSDSPHAATDAAVPATKHAASNSSLIVGLDHVLISVADLALELANYSALLDASPCWRGLREGRPAAMFDAGNLRLCLCESTQPAGLVGLCFGITDRGRMRRRLSQVGLRLEPQADAVFFAENDSASLDVLAPECARGLWVGFVSRNPLPSEHRAVGVTGLDHVVIASTDAQATAFFLAAQLGLDMRLDIHRPEWNSRMLFFRCGDLIVEVVQKLGDSPAGTQDAFYGLSWRVADAEATHARLSALGVELTPVRAGRKPGTKVLSVQSRTAAVATLLLQPV